MKKILFIILVLVLSVSVMADVLTKTTVTTSAAAVIDTTSGVLVYVEGYNDANENTAAARALHFYDASAVTNTAAAAHSSYIRSVTVAAGVFTTGDLFKGFVIKQWSGANEVVGIEYSTGLVVSPSAAADASVVNGVFRIKN